jgi:hypothetical protein
MKSNKVSFYDQNNHCLLPRTDDVAAMVELSPFLAKLTRDEILGRQVDELRVPLALGEDRRLKWKQGQRDFEFFLGFMCLASS